MKKVLAVLLILALMLSGCAVGGAGEQSTDPTEDAAPSVQNQPEAEKPTPAPGGSQESAEDPTEGPAEDPADEPAEDPTETTQPEGYLQQVPWEGFMIFDGPSFDAAPVQPLPVGTYTIVDGAQDDEGLHWGKLKSGLGWICLSRIREFNAPVSIGQAGEELLEQVEFSYSVEEHPYSFPVVIQACENLREIQIFTCQLGESRMEPDELIYQKQAMKKNDLMVVELDFPGDFSVYHVCFQDEDGELFMFQVSVSGRNGTIEAWNIPQ